MYGFEITVISAGDPDSLFAKLDEITDQLALASSGNEDFKGYMVIERKPGEIIVLITVDADNEAKALSAATSWLHSAVHAAGFSTPGWLKCAEQVFDGTPASC